MNSWAAATPGMSQQVQSGMSNSQTSSALQSAQSKFFKVWEVIYCVILDNGDDKYAVLVEKSPCNE